MKVIILSILVAISAVLSAGSIQLQPQEKNLADEQSEAARFLDELARGKSSGTGSRQASYGSYAANQAVASWQGALDFKNAGKSAYQTNATLDAMTALSLAGLQSIGTPAQGDMAERLSNYGQQLSQSNSPALAQAGGNLQDQAAAMNSGNIPAAQTASQNLQSMPRMSLPPGYMASYADKSWDDAMKGVGQEFMGSFASAAGEAAVSALASSLADYFSKSSTKTATGTGSSNSGFWASMLGNMAGKLGKGVVNGTNSPGNVADSSKGLANQAGSALGKQAGTGGSANQSEGGLPTMSGSSLPGASSSSGGGLDTVIKASGGGSAAGSALPGSK